MTESASGKTPDPQPSHSLPYAQAFRRALARRTGRRLWRGMVRWFDPPLLLRTLVALVVARLFATYADRRERAVARPGDGASRYDHEPELWLDYVADLGDGWNATATVAGLIAAPQLAVDGQVLPHARVLLMGGDQAYPVASREEYLARLEAPYYSLHPQSPAHAPRDLFVLPGNHDWYDGLAAFARLFLQQRWFAGWKTSQTRSYFVLRLPQRWWLLAVDVQLDNDIDAAQLDYLLAATEEIRAGDGVIFMNAAPHWLEPEDSVLQRNLAFLQRRLVADRGATVRLALAGDLHHYSRYAAADGSQRITAGGGGAFLHGTAWQPESVSGQRPDLREDPEIEAPPDTTWRRERSFPSPLQSRLVLWRLWAFPFYNLPFALLLGLVSVLLLRASDSASHGMVFASADAGAAAVAWSLFDSLPSSPVLLAAWFGWFAAFMAFADRPRWGTPLLQHVLRVCQGLTHAGLHLWLALLALVLVEPSRLFDPFGFFASLAALTVVIAAGSGLLFGWWLWLLYQLAGGHRETAFSACRIADWKHFLRLHIAADGALTVYVLGIERVCRRWREREPVQLGEAFVEPADGVPLVQRARLVERVVIPPR